MAEDEGETGAISSLTGSFLQSFLGDELQSGSALTQLGLGGHPSLNSNRIYGDDYDEDDDVVGGDVGDDWEAVVDMESQNELPDEEQKPQLGRPVKQKRVRVIKTLIERPKTVYERFPAFEKDKTLDFSELFKGYTVRKSRVAKRPFHVESCLPRRRDPPKGLLKALVGDTRRQVEHQRVEEVVASGSVEDDLRKALQDREKTNVHISLPLDDRSFDLVLLSNWEDQILTNFNGASVTPQPVNLANPVNASLESGAWTQSIIWGPRQPFRDFTQIEFNHEDDVIPDERPATEVLRPKKRIRMDNISHDKFNLSNDHFYELSKDGGRRRVRQTFGQLVVEHAYPAQKLQLPFYKTRLSKQEARSFHRPALQFPTHIELRFSKVRSAKAKKDKAGRKVGKGGDVAEGLHKTSDLSLRDTSSFVLWEFSEEHPPIFSSFGMGSVLVNYYRKKDEKDEHVPEESSDLGEPFVLEPQDETPFMKFGSVIPGQTIPALYNNLLRAPLFRHKPYNTDFLVIRSTTKGESRYYIREIKNLFVVGQTYPVTEVPGPHSRKITTTIKNRLQIIAFKLLQKSSEERLKISRLMKYFPDQNELQMRQRLKEFMEYHRRGPHQGFWRLKSGWSIPNKTDMLKKVTPEDVVLTESMQVGQQHLQDCGYGQAVEDDDDANLSIEQQLAPWITTKNFLAATQAKAMLRLHGEGDPSSRGEAFNFIRVSMKEIFVKAGENYDQKMAEADNRPKSAHRYNVAEQQLIYKSEVERIWKAQFDSLSRKTEPELSAAERNAKDEPSPPAAFPVYSQAPVPAPRDQSLPPEAGGHKVLRIRRLVDGEWRTEIVRDSAVINAYLRKRALIEEEETVTSALAPTGDEERDKRARKRLEEDLARMKKNQERRLHRKNAKIVKEGGIPMALERPLKPDTSRRCGHCGQIGHMKTNRKCPRWAEFNSGAPPLPPAGSPSGSQMPSPAGVSGLAGGLGFASSPAESGMFSPSIGSAPFRGPSVSYGFPAAVPSPLAMSPPMSAADDDAPSGSTAPKIKLTLKRP